ncbi:MAG: hypothetical protein P4L81_08505, partial [Candidatus Pacebacteria bacterium]|nr:hypothetical protein [Candidatus Paceibacterota bacterium]
GQTRASSHSRALVSSVKIGFWRLADMESSYAAIHTEAEWLCQGYNRPFLGAILFFQALARHFSAALGGGWSRRVGVGAGGEQLGNQ